MAAKKTTKKTTTKTSTDAKAANGTAYQEMEDGTIVEYTLRNGEVISAVVQSGKACCPTCHRALPKPKVLTEKQKARLEARKQKLLTRAYNEMEKIKAMLAKTGAKLNEDVPEDLDAILAEGEKLAAASGDE